MCRITNDSKIAQHHIHRTAVDRAPPTVYLCTTPTFIQPCVVHCAEDMAVLSKIYSGYQQEPDQSQIYADGNAYLKTNYPLMTFATTVVVM